MVGVDRHDRFCPAPVSFLFNFHAARIAGIAFIACIAGTSIVPNSTTQISTITSLSKLNPTPKIAVSSAFQWARFLFPPGRTASANRSTFVRHIDHIQNAGVSLSCERARRPLHTALSHTFQELALAPAQRLRDPGAGAHSRFGPACSSDRLAVAGLDRGPHRGSAH